MGGYPAKRIELTLPAGACAGERPRYWPGAGPNLDSGYCCMAIPSTQVISIVDVDGERVVVVARHLPETPAQDRAELQGIVDSIQFELPLASPSPADASPSP